MPRWVRGDGRSAAGMLPHDTFDIQVIAFLVEGSDISLYTGSGRYTSSHAVIEAFVFVPRNRHSVSLGCIRQHPGLTRHNLVATLYLKNPP